ncbi:hypothetical protein C8F04DRAFT_1259205 [Mycena alexandri]|uniref:Zn(2)-C6 fungal-type domain-containing protein n=1 Tax=Mycena alexandri TaxID=1745969 RepID=A0AAD6X7N0_9AGAR|nr:hypothetical protein C8F04DRAFT_1259205 [Mycena alexandri]
MEPIPPSQLPAATAASTIQWVFPPTPNAPPLLIPGRLNPTTGEFIAHDAPRQRISIACTNCRQRRTKCTGTYPSCERCLERKLLCEYPTDRKRGRGPARPKPKLSGPPLPKNVRRLVKIDPGKSGDDYDASDVELEPLQHPSRHGDGHEARDSSHHTSTILPLELSLPPASTPNSHFPGLHEYDYAGSATYSLSSAAYSGSSAPASSSAYPASSSTSPYPTVYAGSFPRRPAPMLPRRPDPMLPRPYAIATSLTASYYSYYPNPGPSGTTPYYPYPNANPAASLIAMDMDMDMDVNFEREGHVPISALGQDHRAAWPLEAGYALHHQQSDSQSSDSYSNSYSNPDANTHPHPHSHSKVDVDCAYDNADAAREVDHENGADANDNNIDPMLRLPLAPEISHTRTGAPSEDDHALHSNVAQVEGELGLQPPASNGSQTQRPRLQLRTRPALSLNMGFSRGGGSALAARRASSRGSTSLGSAGLTASNTGSAGLGASGNTGSVNPAALRGARSFSTNSAGSTGSGSGWGSGSAESASVGSRSAGSGDSGSSAGWSARLSLAAVRLSEPPSPTSAASGSFPLFHGPQTQTHSDSQSPPSYAASPQSYPPSPHSQSPDIIPTTNDNDPRAHSAHPHPPSTHSNSPSPHPSSAHHSHPDPAAIPAHTYPHFSAPPLPVLPQAPSAFMYSAHAHAQTHSHVSRPSSANVSEEQFAELSVMYEPPSMQFPQNRAGAGDAAARVYKYNPEPQYVAPVRAYSGLGTQLVAGQTFMTSMQERMVEFGAVEGGEGIGAWVEPPSMPIARASSASMTRPGSSASARGVQGISSASGSYARTRTRTVSPVQEGGVQTPPSRTDKTTARAVSSYPAPMRAHGSSGEGSLFSPVRARTQTEADSAGAGAGDGGEGEDSLFSSPVRSSGLRSSPVRELVDEDADCETRPSASGSPFSASTITD